MVKFICTRQDWVAERLGVQSLTFSGYQCPSTDSLVDQDNLTPEAENLSQNAVTGLFLLNKTLFFIQQLTRDMVNHQDGLPLWSLVDIFFSKSLRFSFTDSLCRVYLS